MIFGCHSRAFEFVCIVQCFCWIEKYEFKLRHTSHCDHSFIQTLTVTSSFKVWFFNGESFFIVRVWLSSVQLNSIRDENDGWAHFQILVVVLFALPLIIICIYHIPLCSVWITLCCGCVSFSCGFSLVYLHHISQCILFTSSDVPYQFKEHRQTMERILRFVHSFVHFVRHAFYGLFYMTVKPYSQVNIIHIYFRAVLCDMVVCIQ